MHLQQARNFRKGAAIEIVRREQKSIFGGKRGQRLVGRGPDSGIDCGDRVRIRRGKLLAVFFLLVQTYQAALAAIAIDVLLRHYRSQPAFE